MSNLLRGRERESWREQEAVLPDLQLNLRPDLWSDDHLLQLLSARSHHGIE